jgi:hypothetical protein
VAAATVGSTAMGDAPGYGLSRFDLRAGIQLGVHVQICRLAAIYADGTIDYDGQYRIHVGVAVGNPKETSPPRW